MEKLRENYRNLERFYAEDMNKMTHIINSLSDNAQVFISPTNNEKVVGEIDADIKIGDIVIDDGSVNPDQKGFIYKVENIEEIELNDWIKCEFSSLTPDDDAVMCAKYTPDGTYYAMNTEVMPNLKQENGILVTVENVEGVETITDGVTDDIIVNIKPSLEQKGTYNIWKKEVDGEAPRWLSVRNNTTNGVSFCDDETITDRSRDLQVKVIITGTTAYTVTEIVINGEAEAWLSFKPSEGYFKSKDKLNDSDVKKTDFCFFAKKSRIVTVVTLSTLNDGSGGGSSEGHVYNEEKHSLAEGRYTIAEGYDSHAEGYGIWCKVKILSYESDSITVKLLDPEYESASSHEGERLQCNNSVKLKEEYESFRRLGYQFKVINEPDNTISDVSFEEVSTRDYYYYEMIISFTSNLHGADNWWQKDYVELIMENRAENNGSHSEGKGTFALGRNTHTEGLVTQATNDNAHAEGHLTKATGLNSHAEGLRTIASGENSHAEGYSDGDIDTEIIVQSINTDDKTLTVNHTWYNAEHVVGQGSYLDKGTVIEYQGYKFAIINVDNTTLTVREEIEDSIYRITSGSYVQVLGSTASGKFSHVEGRSTCAMGESSHAEGKNTVAVRAHSHSEGQGTVAYGHVSHAEGIGTLANGSYSHSEGERTQALGNCAHAEGVNTTASGYYSHSEGYRTTASGHYSHAEGLEATASGEASHAEGNGTTASGHYSHSEGYRTTASGHYSHAEGSSTRASGYYSHAEGSGTTASGYYSHAEGYNTTATRDYSHAEGRNTIASARYSHAEGCNTSAVTFYSHSEGHETKASGSGSHAEGYLTEASGYYSHAEGSGTTASGDYSHSEGYHTTASGETSHAEGFLTEASGYYTHAEGRRTQAKNGADGEHAEGVLNISHANTISSIGCGYISTSSVAVRCNAFEVLSEGDVYIKGIGGYTGQNDPNPSDVKSLQEYISSLEERIRQLENNQ